MDKIKSVLKQYENKNNLKTRMNIHEMYSTNKQGFMNWIFEKYQLEKNFKILELGCGDSTIWKNHIGKCEIKYSLTLSDISPGMIQSSKKNLANKKNIDYKIIDIQNIPYDDDTFDIVIANMMLYHVPDINLGLKEVNRVLKPNGTFYCATFGEKNVVSYINNVAKIKILNEMSNKFTLQNGNIILSPFFNCIQKDIYNDSLNITDLSHLIDYLNSFSEFSKLSHNELNNIVILLKEEFDKNDGIINIPKEYGIFIAKEKL